MLKASLESPHGENQALLAQFKIQGDGEMYSQLHDYENSHGFDLSNEMVLSAITKRIFTGFREPS